MAGQSKERSWFTVLGEQVAQSDDKQHPYENFLAGRLFLYRESSALGTAHSLGTQERV